MFKYFVKHYIRNMSRRKLFSFIKITGLAFAIAFMILIGQFIYYEFNYNSSIKDVDSIYRLVNDDAKNYWADYRIKDMILEEIPGVKDVCLLNRFGIDLNVNDKVFQIKDMLVVNQNFFNFFDFQFIQGNSEDALSTIESIVLTKTTGKNIFGTTDVIGKTLRLNHQYDMLVTGVVKDLPRNLSFNAEIFVSSENSPKERLIYKKGSFSFDGKDESLFPFNIFIKLDNRANIRVIEKQVSDFSNLNKYLFSKKVRLTPLSDNYFNTVISDGDLMHGNTELIKILSIIGVIILLLAIINFVNLATAAYKYRLTEISIKKCFGADRQILIKQLLTESLITCFISGILGVVFAELFLPYFNQFIDKSLTLQIFSSTIFLVLFISFLLLLGILTGFFPAVLLSKISPLQIFKLKPVLKGVGIIPELS